jgi:prepilin signal peptidase PulO-like enzyme (type II secretory pathway)
MIFIVLAIVGLCLGSFINALVWRLHEQSKTKAKQKLARLSIARGRSMCVHCGHELAVRDLIPVLSWLSLQGKCRYCHKPISWQYPLVELLTAGLSIFSYVFWPLAFHGESITLFCIWLLLLTGFIALLVYDARWMLLPDRIIFPLIGLALLQVVLQFVFFHGGNDLAKGLVGGLAFSAGLFYLLHQVSDGKWLGGGDVKLALIIGLLLPSAEKVLLMLFIASITGTLYALPALLRKRLKANSRVPFGPFLIVATVLVYLFGSSIISWYYSHLIIV